MERLHVDDLGDAALHDEKMRVVDVKVHAHEHTLDLVGGLCTTVQRVLRLAFGDDSADYDSVAVDKLRRAALLVRIVEGDGDRGARDARIAAFVNQLLQVIDSYMRQSLDAEHETNCVANVGLARAVQTGDTIELAVEGVENGARRV